MHAQDALSVLLGWLAACTLFMSNTLSFRLHAAVNELNYRPIWGKSCSLGRQPLYV